MTDHALHYLHLPPGASAPALDEQPTRALVMLDTSVEPLWQGEISRWLTRIGCLYMLAWGVECSSWDDAVDDANLEAFDYGDIPRDREVLTTWHADDSMQDYLWFAKHSAVHHAVELTRTLILHIGPTPRERELLAAYAEA
jgi:hypothetical protein